MPPTLEVHAGYSINPHRRFRGIEAIPCLLRPIGRQGRGTRTSMITGGARCRPLREGDRPVAMRAGTLHGRRRAES